MKKKIDQHESSEHEEEGYFMSFSDLMSGVLLIFIILTAGLALNYHEKEKQLFIKDGEIAREKDRLKSAEKEVMEEKKKKKNAESQSKAFKEALDNVSRMLRDRDELSKASLREFAKNLKNQQVDVDLDEMNGVITLPEQLLFSKGEAKLEVSGEQKLRIIAKDILMLAEKNKRWETIYIEGHTDDIPIHTAEFSSNWELSSARSINTFRALVQYEPKLGSLLNQNQRNLLGISAYAENRPIASNADELGRKKNRRIDIRFVMMPLSENEVENMKIKTNNGIGK